MSRFPMPMFTRSGNEYHNPCPECGRDMGEGEAEACEGTCERCQLEAHDRAVGMVAYEGAGAQMKGQHER